MSSRLTPSLLNALPRLISDSPAAYTSAVSKKLIPSSRAFFHCLVCSFFCTGKGFFEVVFSRVSTVADDGDFETGWAEETIFHFGVGLHEMDLDLI